MTTVPHESKANNVFELQEEMDDVAKRILALEPPTEHPGQLSTIAQLAFCYQWERTAHQISRDAFRETNARKRKRK